MALMSIISPAKSLDFDLAAPASTALPRFPKEIETLISKLSKLKPNALGKLMSISPALSDLNVHRYQAFDNAYPSDQSKAAIYAFKGDVYQGLNVEDFNDNEQGYLQSNLRILSGLYGLLKPMDAMQAYRLEMGTKLKIRRADNLYQFWGDKITDLLNQDLEENKSEALINLASNEYFRSIKTAKLAVPLINVHFKEYRDDKLKVISFSAKRARGMMVRYMAKNALTKAEDIKSFNLDNYLFDDAQSTDRDFLFTR